MTMQNFEVDTPDGKLAVTWPQPEIIWDLDHPGDPEPVTVMGPQRPPLATLNGQEITVEQAKVIVRAALAKASGEGVSHE
jgi:hypothetical protein